MWKTELSRLLGGRKVDLRTPMDLSRHFRDEVVQKRTRPVCRALTLSGFATCGRLRRRRWR